VCDVACFVFSFFAGAHHQSKTLILNTTPKKQHAPVYTIGKRGSAADFRHGTKVKKGM
jgi:hypothetical protein